MPDPGSLFDQRSRHRAAETQSSVLVYGYVACGGQPAF